MIDYTIKDMTCGKCVKRITEALTTLDSEVEIDVDIETHRLSVISEKAEADIKSAITEAGYTPVLTA